MRVLIANDHRGVALKKKLLDHFKDIEFKNFGADSEDRVDYPDLANQLSEKISNGSESRGILICGTGIGMSIAANKYAGVRAAMVWNPEVAKLTRQHNDSNVLCLSGDFTDEKTAFDIVEVWLKTPFEGGRHTGRLQKIKNETT